MMLHAGAKDLTYNIVSMVSSSASVKVISDAINKWTRKDFSMSHWEIIMLQIRCANKMFVCTN